jgi:hypothetical protein
MSHVNLVGSVGEETAFFLNGRDSLICCVLSSPVWAPGHTVLLFSGCGVLMERASGCSQPSVLHPTMLQNSKKQSLLPPLLI